MKRDRRRAESIFLINQGRGIGGEIADRRRRRRRRYSSKKVGSFAEEEGWEVKGRCERKQLGFSSPSFLVFPSPPSRDASGSIGKEFSSRLYKFCKSLYDSRLEIGKLCIGQARHKVVVGNNNNRGTVDARAPHKGNKVSEGALEARRLSQRPTLAS